MHDGDDGTVYTGVLVRWDADRGYGFIRPAGGGRDADVFVHRAVLADSGRTVGTRLRFAVQYSERGPRALWCELETHPLVDAPAVQTRGPHAGDAYPDEADTDRPRRRW